MDQTLSHLINVRWTNPALDLLMAAVSDVNIWRPLLIIVALAAVVFGGFKMRACVFSLLLSLLIAQQVTNVRKIIEGLGLEIASPDEAREILSLKGGDKVGF